MDFLAERIKQAILVNTTTIKHYEDALILANSLSKNDKKSSLELIDIVRKNAIINIKKGKRVDEWADIEDRALLIGARLNFILYMLALEKNRPIDKRFYIPRAKKLKEIVDSFCLLDNKELNEILLSQPPRTGKTCLSAYFMTYRMGIDPEKANLYVTNSSMVSGTFYDAVISILEPNVKVKTYRWNEIFPERKVVSTDSKELTIDIDRAKQYHTLTCRSIDGALNGSCDCDGVLMLDDLVEGIEQAMSPSRLAKLWQKVTNDALSRAKEGCSIVWIGTRWSIQDPIGIRIDVLENTKEYENAKFKIVNVPALDTHGFSNFDYPFNVGFSTEEYLKKRINMERTGDIASWNAQYMGEPIEREGALITPDSCRYYNGILPDERPDRVFLWIDPAFGGGDYTAGPIVFQYGENDLYVHDVVYSNQTKDYTIPLIVKKVEKNNVKALELEANNGGNLYKDELDKSLKTRGIGINIKTRYTTRYGKAERGESKKIMIFDSAPEIMQKFIFLDDKHREKDYSQFMASVFSFTVEGKNKHDDAIESLCRALEMTRLNKPKVKAFARTF